MAGVFDGFIVRSFRPPADAARLLEGLPEDARRLTAEAIGAGLPEVPEAQRPTSFLGYAAQHQTAIPYADMDCNNKLEHVRHFMTSVAWKKHLQPGDGEQRRRNAAVRAAMPSEDYDACVQKAKKSSWAGIPHWCWVRDVVAKFPMDWTLDASCLEDLTARELSQLLKAESQKERQANKRRREVHEEAEAVRRRARLEAEGRAGQDAGTWDGTLRKARVNYLVEQSKSNRATCRKCGEAIPKKAVRIQLKAKSYHRASCECERCEAARVELSDLGLLGFYHLKCVAAPPGVHVTMDDLAGDEGRAHWSGWSKLPKKLREEIGQALEGAT